MLDKSQYAYNYYAYNHTTIVNEATMLIGEESSIDYITFVLDCQPTMELKVIPPFIVAFIRRLKFINNCQSVWKRKLLTQITTLRHRRHRSRMIRQWSQALQRTHKMDHRFSAAWATLVQLSVSCLILATS
jgi:hypothetical protein